MTLMNMTSISLFVHFKNTKKRFLIGRENSFIDYHIV